MTFPRLPTVILLLLVTNAAGQGQECLYSNLVVQVGATSLTTGCSKGSVVQNEGRCHYSMGTTNYYNCPSAQCVNSVWVPSEVVCTLADTSLAPHTASNQIVLSVNPAILQQYGQTAPEVQWVETMASFLYISKNRFQASRLSSTELILILRQTDCGPETCGSDQICKDADGFKNGIFSCTCTAPKSGHAENGFAHCDETVVGDCVDDPCGVSNLQICSDPDGQKNGQFECSCSAISGVVKVSRNTPVSGCGVALLRNDGYTNDQVIADIVDQSRCCPNACMSSRSRPSAFCSTLGVLGVSDGNVCQSFPTKRSCASTACMWDEGTSSCIAASNSDSDDSVSAGVWVAMVAVIVLVVLALVAAMCWWQRVGAMVDKKTNPSPARGATEPEQHDIQPTPPRTPPPDYESLPLPSVGHLPSIPKAPPALPISERLGGDSDLPFFDTSAAENLPPLGLPATSLSLQERKHTNVYSSMWDD